MANNQLLNILKNRTNKKKLSTAKVTTSAIPSVDDPTLQTWIKSIDTWLRQVASDGVSKSDLVEYGVLGFNNGNLESILSKGETVDLTVPMAVLNFTANGAYSSVTLDWETTKNKNFGYNAVYRSEINDFGTAAQVGSTTGDVYTDYIGNGTKAYYWIRSISKYAVEGDLSPSAYAETSLDIPYILEQLKDKITSNQFTQSLRTEISNISTSLGTEIGERIQLAEDMALQFFNLQSEVTNNASANSATITNVQNTLNTKIENVAQEISLITAGVGEQFDTFKIWFFDENTLEGWTSNGGLPQVQNGWIRPFLNGADTFLLSPPANSFLGSAYPDIRFRIKKVGNPIWDATLSWGDGFAVYVSIPEPIWNLENNIGTVQKNIDWIGNIGQIKLKLAATQDENNYYAVDWFAFGRPSPAASWSAIGEVKTAIANEKYARTQYETSNEAKWTNNDAVYRGLVQSAIDIAADENGVTASKMDNFIAERTTSFAGSEDDFAGDPGIFVGHLTEETLRIMGDEALLDEIEILSIKVNDEISAAITEEKQIRANADSAMALQITTMQAKVDNDITAAIQNESIVRAEQNNALAQTIGTVQTTVGQNTAAIQETKTSINGINAEWKIKVQAGGKVSGVSLGTTGTESQFLILADRFAVGQTVGTTTIYPFIIDDGKVIMNTVIIKDGSITNAKVGNLNADKITAGNIAADRMKVNIVQAVEGQFNSLSAISGTIGTLRTATSGARTEIRDNLIQVFDSAGKVRVKLGVW